MVLDIGNWLVLYFISYFFILSRGNLCNLHDRVIGSRTGLRMMMFGAGVLAVLLACAGAAAGVAAGAFPADLAQPQVKLNSC